MVADPAQYAVERFDVLFAERSEEQFVKDGDVPGEYGGEDTATIVGNGDGGAALIVYRRGAGDEAALLESLRLIGKPAAAVDHAVGEIRHPPAALRRIAEPGEQLKLHVTQVAGLPQLLFHRVPDQAADLN